MRYMKKYQDVISGIALLAISVFYLINAFSIKILSRVSYNAAMFPKLLGIALGVLSLLQIGSSLIKFGRHSMAETPSAPSSPRIGHVRVIATLIALGGYLFLLRDVGFLLMTMFYVFAQILILSPRGKLNILILALLSTVFPVAVYALFVHGFQLMLPRGVLSF